MKRRITEKGASRTRKEAERLVSSVERICLRREFKDGLSVYPDISPRLFVLRVEMSIGRVV